MKSLTVFVMLDACRPDYINKETTPFLHDLAFNGFSGPVKPTFGFEPDAAYLAGLFPDEADGGAQFWRKPDESPFEFTRWLPEHFNRFPELPQKIIRKLIKRFARRNSESPNLSTARIPFHLLNQFSMAMSHHLDHPEFLNTETLFDLLRKYEKSYIFHAAPDYRVTMEAVLDRAKKELFQPVEFAFFHIGNLDRVGHKYGPVSEEITQELTHVDKGLEHLYENVKHRFNRINMVIMGDHGMMEVNRHLNLLTQIKKRNLVNGRDFLYILDSTMARFWFYNKAVQDSVKSILSGVTGGRILTPEDHNFYHLNWPHNRFGDLIFLADPGTLIFPNHFQLTTPVKGMHGYDPESKGQQAALIINGPGIQPRQKAAPSDMRRVFPTLCSLLKLDRLGPNSLESLVIS